MLETSSELEIRNLGLSHDMTLAGAIVKDELNLPGFFVGSNSPLGDRYELLLVFPGGGVHGVARAIGQKTLLHAELRGFLKEGDNPEINTLSRMARVGYPRTNEIAISLETAYENGIDKDV
jgi:hypothetical protein